MARSATDATRFTPSHPHVAAKPHPRPSFLTIPDSPPPNETPQQKVARLRAAAASARRAQESQFDRVVLVGRRWADRAHKVTAFSLIGLSLICGVFSSFAIGDMLMHNRRKRNEWLAEKQRETAELTEEARKAYAAGTANGDQMLLLNRERAASESEATLSGRGFRAAPPSVAPARPIPESPAMPETQPQSIAAAAQTGGVLDREADKMLQDTRSWFGWPGKR